MSRHTKGPWHVLGCGTTLRIAAHSSLAQKGSLRTIASVNNRKPISDAEVRANAELLAAAPDLLLALQTALAGVMDPLARRMAKEAVVKAGLVPAKPPGIEQPLDTPIGRVE